MAFQRRASGEAAPPRLTLAAAPKAEKPPPPDSSAVFAPQVTLPVDPPTGRVKSARAPPPFAPPLISRTPPDSDTTPGPPVAANPTCVALARTVPPAMTKRFTPESVFCEAVPVRWTKPGPAKTVELVPLAVTSEVERVAALPLT